MRALPSFALAFALISASQAQALSYGVAALPNGSTAIVAEGRIHRNEAARLLTLVQRAAAVSGSIPRTLVISSPGGELVGALALGEALRQLGVRTVVGSIASDGYGQATLSPGRCHSACVFVLMGGAARSVVPGSLVGVHSPQPVMVVGGRAYLPDSETTRHVIQQTAPVLRSYARQMGVSPSLVDVANDVPHTTVRNLSSYELARYSLVTQPRHPRATTAHKVHRRQRSR
jgi:hypothetical protein